MERVERVFADPDPIWAPLFYGGVAARLQDALPTWRDRLDPGLVEVVEAGARIGALELKKAEFARAAFYHEVRRFFVQYDLLLSPTLVATPFAAGRSGRRMRPAGRAWRGWPSHTRSI